jgi:hypothetical protein
MSSESIQIIANNNYEGLQHLNFIFSQKNSVQNPKNWLMMKLTIGKKVCQDFLHDMRSQFTPAASYA